MDRQPPRTTSNEIDLYIRTYYSLLRSSGDVRVRGFEEAHLYSASSLHAGALAPEPDLAAFAYSAGRLPACFPRVRRMLLGQSIEQLARAGFPVSTWQTVRTRGRRRPLRWDGGATLAVFVASASDIDDLVPIITAYQIEWNKLHFRLAGSGIEPAALGALDDVALAGALGTDSDGVRMLRAAFGSSWADGLAALARHELDLTIRLLDGSFREYQRSAKTWWDAIQEARPELMQRPVYFVSSNTHSLANLLGGYALTRQDEIVEFARREDPEGTRAAIASWCASA